MGSGQLKGRKNYDIFHLYEYNDTDDNDNVGGEFDVDNEGLRGGGTTAVANLQSLHCWCINALLCIAFCIARGLQFIIAS